jgi:hypothetical protein
MYPQQQAFSQPTFPQGYPPQPPSYSLPSSSIYPVDPGSFRCDYTARLAGLTDNSRVIIQALSMYAHDFSRWGDVVTQCIEAHIRRVSGPLSSIVSSSACLSDGLEDGVTISKKFNLVVYVRSPTRLRTVGVERKRKNALVPVLSLFAAVCVRRVGEGNVLSIIYLTLGLLAYSMLTHSLYFRFRFPRR